MTETIEAADYAALAKKPSKYGNKKIEEDGYTFDSLAEHRRYRELKLIPHNCLIVHPTFQLWVNSRHICDYVADFQWFDHERNIWVVEDVKGVKTEAYRLKKKLMKATYGIDITEIDA